MVDVHAQTCIHAQARWGACVYTSLCVHVTYIENTNKINDTLYREFKKKKNEKNAQIEKLNILLGHVGGFKWMFFWMCWPSSFAQSAPHFSNELCSS